MPPDVILAPFLRSQRSTLLSCRHKFTVAPSLPARWFDLVLRPTMASRKSRISSSEPLGYYSPSSSGSRLSWTKERAAQACFTGTGERYGLVVAESMEAAMIGVFLGSQDIKASTSKTGYQHFHNSSSSPTQSSSTSQLNATTAEGKAGLRRAFSNASWAVAPELTRPCTLPACGSRRSQTRKKRVGIIYVVVEPCQGRSL